MVSKNVEVNFKKCSGAGCETDANMDAWLSDLHIQTWIIEEKIDFLDYIDKPTRVTQRRLAAGSFAETIHGKVIPVMQLDILRNEFYMEDDWF